MGKWDDWSCSICCNDSDQYLGELSSSPVLRFFPFSLWVCTSPLFTVTTMARNIGAKALPASSLLLLEVLAHLVLIWKYAGLAFVLQNIKKNPSKTLSNMEFLCKNKIYFAARICTQVQAVWVQGAESVLQMSSDLLPERCNSCCLFWPSWHWQALGWHQWSSPRRWRRQSACLSTGAATLPGYGGRDTKGKFR